jgi:hypothetical protein
MIHLNKQINDTLQGADTVKFKKSLPPRWYGHVPRIQNQQMPKKKLQHLQWKEQGKEEHHVKDCGTRMKRI